MDFCFLFGRGRGGEGDAKKKGGKSDEANVLYVCVDRWVDGWMNKYDLRGKGKVCSIIKVIQLSFVGISVTA